MKILHFRLVKNNIYSILSVLLSLFSFVIFVTRNYYMLIGTIICFLAILKKWKFILFSISFLIILIFIYLLTVSNPVYEKIHGNYNVKKKTWFGFLIKHNKSNIFVFSKINISKGDELFISGKPYIYNGKMENYFRSLNVKSILSYPFIKKISINRDFFTIIKNTIVSGNNEYHKLSTLLLFGEKNILNKNFYNLSTEMNISYLFVISGFHITILYLVIFKTLFFLKTKFREIISFFIIFIYLLFLGMPISALRAFLMLYIYIGSKYFKKINFSKIEIMAISLIVITIIYPYSIFSFSLPLSFISTFLIINIFSLEIKSYKKLIMVPFLMLIFMLPFTILFNNAFSVFSPLYSLIITPIFVVFYVLLILFLPFRILGNQLCNIFIFLIKNFSAINLKIEISNEYSWIFFAPYLLLSISFITYEIKNSYLVKKFLLN